jgi:flavorubredoxin
MITNRQSGTAIDEIADGIYRVSTPVTVVPGGFTFNQYLILDDEPLLFHTGLRRLFPAVREAVAA